MAIGVTTLAQFNGVDGLGSDASDKTSMYVGYGAIALALGALVWASMGGAKMTPNRRKKHHRGHKKHGRKAHRNLYANKRHARRHHKKHGRKHARHAHLMHFLRNAGEAVVAPAMTPNRRRKHARKHHRMHHLMHGMHF